MVQETDKLRQYLQPEIMADIREEKKREFERANPDLLKIVNNWHENFIYNAYIQLKRNLEHGYEGTIAKTTAITSSLNTALNFLWSDRNGIIDYFKSEIQRNIVFENSTISLRQLNENEAFFWVVRYLIVEPKKSYQYELKQQMLQYLQVLNFTKYDFAQMEMVIIDFITNKANSQSEN